MRPLITVEVLKQIADKYVAKFARYDIERREFQLSNDNENWFGSVPYTILILLNP